MADSIIPELTLRLHDRLSELRAECALIEGALAVLDDRYKASAPRPAPRRTATYATRLLRVIEENPESRASMLALTTGASIDAVMATLSGLEASGKITRVGLGWSPTDSSTRHVRRRL